MKTAKYIAAVGLLFAKTVDADSIQIDELNVEFGSREHKNCKFVGSPIDFCSPKFTAAYREALDNRDADFNHDMILLALDSRLEYMQQTLVAISPLHRTIYPFPFDFFSSSFSATKKKAKGTLVYSLRSNSVCIKGAILAYRSVQDGQLCWRFIDQQFSGEITPYTYPEH